MEKKIKVIPPTAELDNAKRLKVAAYCRVSNDREDLSLSLKLQAAHFTKLSRHKVRHQRGEP